MQLSDYYPLIVMVAVIVGAVFAIRIFFTLWAPVDARVNRDRFGGIKGLQIAELKDKTVNVHLRSGIRIDGIGLVGYATANHQATPYQLRQMLVGRFSDGRAAYIRIDEIQYMEEVSGGSQAGAGGSGVR